MAMTLRTDEALDQMLDELAKQAHVSKQEIVRRAVVEKWERDQRATRVAEAADRVEARWGDVLHRLGTV